MILRMPRKQHLLIAALSLGAGCSGDPDYGTRPADEWARKLQSDTVLERLAAANAFAHAPPHTYPVVRSLLAAGNDRDSTVRGAVLMALQRLKADAAPALRKALRDTSVSVRRRATATLGSLTESSKKSVDPLVERLGDADDSVRVLAVRALGQLGPTAYGARDTLKTLAGQSGPLRPAALAALPRVDTETHTFISLYDAAAQDTSEAVRIAAVGTLFAAARTPEHDVFPILERALADPSDKVRIIALNGLRFMGDRAKPALAKILALKKAPNPSVRAAADSAALVVGGR